MHPCVIIQFEEYTEVSLLNFDIIDTMFLVIHNPLSNNKKSKKNTQKYVKFFQKNKIDFIIRSSLKIENLEIFLSQNPSITDILYLGGDGTLNYLVNSVNMDKITQNLYFGQSGSGNDFMRSLKPIHQGLITLGSAKTNVKTVSFINGCGLGIDGNVGFFVNQDKKKNKMSYFVNTFRALNVYKPTPMSITIDGKTHEFAKTWFVSVQNGKYFGGGMKVAPHADPTQESFSVTVAHTLKKWQVFFVFMSIYVGLHVKLKKYVTIFTGKNISVQSPDPKYFQADGEVLEAVSSMSISPSKRHQIHSFEKNKIKQAFSNTK
jgi:diacylglycerol kinase (ATP)